MQYNKLVIFLLFLWACAACDSNNDALSSAVGKGGSTSRYTIQGNYLYVVDNVSLQVYSIANKEFETLRTIEISPGIETIFARPDFLYLGANDGMYIFSLVDPASPEFVFRYAHILSCDPVVVQGNRAYVTLNMESEGCGRGISALEIIDITDRYNPALIRSYPMSSPRGLGVDGNFLFISEGPSGLRVYDIADEGNIQLKQHLTELHAFDVIAGSHRVTVTGQDGIWQYSYPDTEPDGGFLKLLSKIPVQRQ